MPQKRINIRFSWWHVRYLAIITVRIILVEGKTMLFNPCIASITDALSILFTSPLVQWGVAGERGWLISTESVLFSTLLLGIFFAVDACLWAFIWAQIISNSYSFPYQFLFRSYNKCFIFFKILATGNLLLIFHGISQPFLLRRSKLLNTSTYLHECIHFWIIWCIIWLILETVYTVTSIKLQI